MEDKLYYKLLGIVDAILVEKVRGVKYEVNALENYYLSHHTNTLGTKAVSNSLDNLKEKVVFLVEQLFFYFPAERYLK